MAWSTSMLTPCVSQWWRMVRVATLATRYQTNRWLWLMVRLYANGLSHADASPAAARRSTSACASGVSRRRLPGRVRKSSGEGASGPAADIAARLHGDRGRGRRPAGPTSVEEGALPIPPSVEEGAPAPVTRPLLIRSLVTVAARPPRPT